MAKYKEDCYAHLGLCRCSICKPRDHGCGSDNSLSGCKCRLCGPKIFVDGPQAPAETPRFKTRITLDREVFIAWGVTLLGSAYVQGVAGAALCIVTIWLALHLLRVERVER